MARIGRFEDLQAWQNARELSRMVYGLTVKDRFSHDYGLRDQIRKAAGSVMHNIAEGFDSGSDPEFLRFLKIARRSSSEVQSELYLALDCGYITSDELRSAYDLTVGINKLINGLITYLRKSSANPPPWKSKKSGAGSTKP